MISVREILWEVAADQGFATDALLRRHTRWLGERPYSRALHRAMMLARRYRPDVSYPALGRIFRRDHTTVIFGEGRCMGLLKVGDEAELAAVARLTVRLDALAQEPPRNPYARGLVEERERLMARVRQIDAHLLQIEEGEANAEAA